MSTSFVTLFWIEFFTNFFTNKNKSYKSVIFNSENSGFIVSKLVVGSAEQDTYFSVCFFLTLQTFTKGVSILKFYIKLQGLVHWLVFFLPNSINGKGYFSNHHQCRSAVAQCTKLRFDKNIVRYSTVSEMSFYSLQLDKTNILNESNFICQNLNDHNGQNLVKTQLCAVVSCAATVFVL